MRGELEDQIIQRAGFAKCAEIEREDRGVGRHSKSRRHHCTRSRPVFSQGKSQRGRETAGGRRLAPLLREAIEREIEPARAGQFEIAKQRRPMRRILPGMKNLPDDREASRSGEALGQEQLINFSFRHRRNDEEQTPKCPTDKTSQRGEQKPGKSATRRER